jgi:hypothetical protein
MQQRAIAFSDLLLREANTDADRIALAYRILYQRQVTEKELALGQAYLTFAQSDPERKKLWEQYSQVLLGSNELMYLP